MLSVDEARRRILAIVRARVPPGGRLDVEERLLFDALGQVLSEDVVAGAPVPPHDNAAMDGYAVIGADLRVSDGRPRVLEVLGESRAGAVPGIAVRPGAAVRITTGAPIPDGADTVVPFELTSETDGAVVDR